MDMWTLQRYLSKSKWYTDTLTCTYAYDPPPAPHHPHHTHTHSGAEVDQEGADRRTSLHEASEAGHSNVTQLLIEEGGADPIARDDNDSTPYDLAFMKGHKEVCTHWLASFLGFPL